MNFLPKLIRRGLKSAVSGLVTGISSGAAAAAHKKTSGDATPFQNAGSGMANIHEQMFGGGVGTQFESQRIQNDHEVRLQHMRDQTQLDLQKMQMKHDAIMSSVSKGHQGVKEVVDFFLGKDKRDFWRSYRDIMKGQ